MSVYIIRRALQSIAVMLVMATLVFIGVYMIGDPAQLLVSADADQADIDRMRRILGLDQPLWRQFLTFLVNLSQGDLGWSFAYGEPALGLVFQRMPATLELVAVAMVMALSVGIPLGLYAGLHPERPMARLLMGTSIVGISIPSFWQALVLIFLLAVSLQVLPAGGRAEAVTVFGITSSLWTLDGWSHVFLPALNLALSQCTLIIRLVRTNVCEIALLDYIRFAWAKGLPRRRIVYVHILRNTLVVLVTVIGLQLGSLIAYSVITETIFAWPGMGKLIIDSITRLDRPVTVAYLMVVVFIFITINLLVDILYTVIDPRIRLRGSGG
ncbi:MAG: ABC transporter permease [Betaproteobacteria bacterium]|jgi:peptide/nickel transport system permease protein|nr:ABC transporter permease [Betaproteobacteria bacterium]